MNMKNKIYINGFSLVEVMIALVVLAVGILGISHLQTKVIRSASDANARAIAATIAQNKVDDLRSFVHLTTENIPTDPPPSPANSVAYVDIKANEGGLIEAGEVDTTDMDIVTNTVFNLSWDTVTDYYYDDVNFSSPTTTVTGPISSFKVVEVSVQWTDVDGSEQTHRVNTVIDGYAPQFTSRFGTSNIGADSPKIPYTPGVVPDVVPIDLDENAKKETSKPLPDVSKKGFSVLTSFESVNYNTQLDTVRREEFRTVSCRCGDGATVNEHLYGRTVWDEENLKLKDEIYSRNYSVTKSAVDDGGGESQAPECRTCCRDALDPDDGGVYKNCRLKRVDGVLRLFDQWKMVAFSIIPANYFDETGVQNYSNAVQELIRSKAGLTSDEFDQSTPETNILTLSDTDRTLVNNPEQIQARAVYMDPVAEGIYNDCGDGIDNCDNQNVPLDRISFFEVNVTNLAGWMPDRDQDNTDYSIEADAEGYTEDHDVIKSNDCSSQAGTPDRPYITNDELVNGCETEFSRGLFYPNGDVSLPPVQSVIHTSNDGLVDRNTNDEPTIFTEIQLIE